MCVPACEEEGLSLDPLRTYLNQENSKEGLSLDPPRKGLTLEPTQEDLRCLIEGGGVLSLDPFIAFVANLSIIFP